MTQQLQQYFQRSPRYVLLPQDSCLIRLAGPKQTPWEEGTEIKDISNSGLSFTAAADLSPNIGEMIRVEFVVPGSQQMACYAKVIRLQALNDKINMVAVEFELLNNRQMTNLQSGLKTKISSTLEQPIEAKKGSLNLIKTIFLVSIGISLFCSSFLLFALYRVLTLPDWISILYNLIKFW
jgi:hypothetical protein